MSIAPAARLLAVALLLGAPAVAQEDPPLPVPLPAPDAPPPADDTPTVEAPPPVASDGELATPGRVPGDASEAARARFGKLRASVAGEHAMRGFELPFNFVQRTAEATQEARIRLRYLDAGVGFVYGAILNKDGSVKQSQMRGPGQGDRASYWGILKDGTVQRLRGRDFETSRADLDGWASMAHDLLLLTQPERLRVMSLRALDVALAGTDEVNARALLVGGEALVLPDVDRDPHDRRSGTLAARAARLEWLEIVTPDIRLWQEPAGRAEPRRLVLGIDPDLGVPELALLAPGVEGPLVRPGLSLIQLHGWRPYGEGVTRPLPQDVRLFELRRAEAAGRTEAERAARDETRLARYVFATRAPLTLWLEDGGSLDGTGLTPESFLPRQ